MQATSKWGQQGGDRPASARRPAKVEEEEWEDDSSKELAQGEDIPIYNICINPLGLHQPQPQEGPSSMGTGQGPVTDQ